MKLSVAPQSNKVVIGDEDNVGTDTGNKNDETDTLECNEVREQEIKAGILAVVPVLSINFYLRFSGHFQSIMC